MMRFSFHASVQGAAHIHHDMPCQDASGSISIPEADGYAFAVADGHGDPSCQRSAWGSEAAANVALAKMRDFALEYSAQHHMLVDESLGPRLVRELAQDIVQAWRLAVLADYAERPLDDANWESMDEEARAITKKRPEHLYGTTLVAGLRLSKSLILIQQGDGFCVLLDGGANVSSPMPEDTRCIGNMTTSLCDEDAHEHVRTVVVNTEESGVCACFVGTDGVDKSLYGFGGLKDFCMEVALDSLGSSNPHAMQLVATPSLKVLSEQGSGDDASLAGYVDTGIVAACAEVLVQEHERYVIEAERQQLLDQRNSMQRMRERYEKTSVSNPGDDSEARERFFEAYERIERRISELDRAMEDDNEGDDTVQALPPKEDVAPMPVPTPAVQEQEADFDEGSEPTGDGVSASRQPAHYRESLPGHRGLNRTVVAVVALLAVLVLGAVIATSVLYSGQRSVGTAAGTTSGADVTTSSDARQTSSAAARKNHSELDESKIEDVLERHEIALDAESETLRSSYDNTGEQYRRCFGPGVLTYDVHAEDVVQLEDAALVRVGFKCGTPTQGVHSSDQGQASTSVEGECVICLRRSPEGNAWEIEGGHLDQELLDASGYTNYLRGLSNENGDESLFESFQGAN